MKSDWKVSSQYIGDTKQYQVYRTRDTDAVDHSGNREYAGDLMTDLQKARDLADRLNAEEGR